MKLNTKIPQLNPSEFDDYIFSNWKPVVSGFYDNFHIERIENYKNFLKLPILPHRRSVNFFIYVTKGMAIRNRGLTKYEVKTNHFFSLSTNQITALDYVSDDIEGYYCHFKSEIFNESSLKIDIEKEFSFFQLTSEPKIEVVEEQNRILNLLQILEIEYRKNDQKRFGLISLYLISLFTEIRLQVQNSPQSSVSASAQIAQSYKNALSSHIYEMKTVLEFADFLSVSPNHLNKCVKQTTGKSAHELLEDMRVLEAKVLLRQSDLSIAEIAFKIGKFDPSDFSRFFRLKTNLTPNQYRKSQN